MNLSSVSSAQRFPLSGDFEQLGIQSEFLRPLTHIGFTLENEGGIPIIVGTEEQINRALGTIWAHKKAGWWNYKDTFLRLEFCDEGEFARALDRECQKK